MLEDQNSAISHNTAKNNKLFFNGEFLKDCLVDSAVLIFSEKKEAVNRDKMDRGHCGKSVKSSCETG